ncbi:unnamed protein product [Sphagnum jensenii]|uniref:RING-type E3 ubiquitin transferase n=1 Tax=Sphagnum jensenii TaxID=128206 RepID=A0ABP0VUW5_9BRYO
MKNDALPSSLIDLNSFISKKCEICRPACVFRSSNWGTRIFLTAVPAPTPASSSSNGSSPLSPALVAVIGVLASAFLVLSYYRIFSKYCTRWQNPPQFITRGDQDYGDQTTIEVAEVWPMASPGLEESLIRRIPTCSYKASEGLVEETECAVCLGEFEEGDALRLLPKCNHAFHTSCIDTWLQSNSTCPLCRINIGLAAGLPHALMPLHLLPHLEAHDHMNPSSATVGEEADHHHSSTPDSVSSDEEGELHLLESDESSSELHVAHQLENIQETAAGAVDDGLKLEMQTSQSPVQLSKSAKRRLHNRASSVGCRVQDPITDHLQSSDTTSGRILTRQPSDPNGKHPLVLRRGGVIMSPLMRRNSTRFARMVRSYSTGSAGSANASHVVVELLRHEINPQMSDLQNIAGVSSSEDYASSLSTNEFGLLHASSSSETRAAADCSIIPAQRENGPVAKDSVTAASSPFVVVDLTEYAMDQQSQENIHNSVPLLQELEVANRKQSGDAEGGGSSLHDHCDHHSPASHGSLVQTDNMNSKAAMLQQQESQNSSAAASRALKSRSFKLSMFKGVKRSGSAGRSHGGLLPSTTSVFSSFRGSHKIHASQPDGVFESLEFV